MAVAKTAVLIGFMGAGKTSVGKLLADMTNWKFVDTDQMIVDKAGKSISDIFADDGEPAFRDMETEVLGELVDARRSIISTGGGIILREENRELIEKIGLSIYLKASPDMLYERVKNESGRPLLDVDDPRAKIEEILSARAPLYEQCRVVLDTGEMNVKRVAARVAAILSGPES